MSVMKVAATATVGLFGFNVSIEMCNTSTTLSTIFDTGERNGGEAMPLTLKYAVHLKQEF